MEINLRRTGRTQKLLVEAVASAFRGEHITVVAHNSSYAKDLVRRCTYTVEPDRVDGTKVIYGTGSIDFIGATKVDEYVKGRQTKLLVDHAAQDKLRVTYISRLMTAIKPRIEEAIDCGESSFDLLFWKFMAMDPVELNYPFLDMSIDRETLKLFRDKLFLWLRSIGYAGAIIETDKLVWFPIIKE